jgi:hypothetical protein
MNGYCLNSSTAFWCTSHPEIHKFNNSIWNGKELAAERKYSTYTDLSDTHICFVSYLTTSYQPRCTQRQWHLQRNALTIFWSDWGQQKRFILIGPCCRCSNPLPCHATECDVSRATATRSAAGTAPHPSVRPSVFQQWAVSDASQVSPWFCGTHHGIKNTVIFQVLTAACMKMAVFWVVAPCSFEKCTDVSEELAASIMRPHSTVGV